MEEILNIMMAFIGFFKEENKMNLLTSVEIKINDIVQLKKFAVAVSQFESNVNIYKGRIVYDAKSIMGVIAIDTSNGVFVEIESDDEEEIAKFKNCMEEFKIWRS